MEGWKRRREFEEIRLGKAAFSRKWWSVHFISEWVRFLATWLNRTAGSNDKVESSFSYSLPSDYSRSPQPSRLQSSRLPISIVALVNSRANRRWEWDGKIAERWSWGSGIGETIWFEEEEICWFAGSGLSSLSSRWINITSLYYEGMELMYPFNPPRFSLATFPHSSFPSHRDCHYSPPFAIKTSLRNVSSISPSTYSS